MNDFFGFRDNDELRRQQLINIIESTVSKLTTDELESLYYDMITKQFIKDRDESS